MRLRFGILTASDRSARGERPDLSGPALAELVQAQGWEVTQQAIVPDDFSVIEKMMIEWADGQNVDILLVTGGTGFAPRDVTPEATRAVIEREAPGISEAMRAASLKVTAHAALARGVAGIRGCCLIIDLPGSPSAAVENLQVILPVLDHAVELMRNDPNAEAHHKPKA